MDLGAVAALVGTRLRLGTEVLVDSACWTRVCECDLSTDRTQKQDRSLRTNLRMIATLSFSTNTADTAAIKPHGSNSVGSRDFIRITYNAPPRESLNKVKI